MEIKEQLKMYQEQTCGNFHDLNTDMDEIKGHLLDIKKTLDQNGRRKDEARHKQKRSYKRHAKRQHK